MPAGHLYGQLGDESRARAQLGRLAADDFASLRVGTEWFAGATLLAEPCALLGATDHAARVYDALLPYADYHVLSQPEFCLGSASRFLGILAATTSHPEDAVGHFERALDLNMKTGALPALAHTQQGYASMLLARRAAGDEPLATQPLDRAARIYEELRMQPWVAGVSKLRRPAYAGRRTSH